MKKENQIKVAFFAEILIRDFDGASRTIYQLIDRIPKEDFTYMFFCGTAPTHDFEHKLYKTAAVTMPFNKDYKASFPYFEKSRMTAALDAFQPDVIHIATPSALGSFAVGYAEENAIPVLTIYHTHFISYMEYYFKSVPFLTGPAESVVAMGYRKFYNRCDLIYVPTEAMMTELKGHGVEEHRLKLWQRGLKHELFNPGKRDPAFMKNITGNDLPVILYASRLVWEKNVETLINIYKEIQKRGLAVNMVIAGDGVAENAAREKMPTAHFLGHVDHEELSILYASSDVFVFPSISETYGNVVVEAMASGATCVIAKGGGSQSLIDDGKTGFLCAPNDAADYVDKIDYVLNHPQEKLKMQAAGYQYTSQLDWDRLADTYFQDMEMLSANS